MPKEKQLYLYLYDGHTITAEEPKKHGHKKGEKGHKKFKWKHRLWASCSFCFI